MKIIHRQRKLSVLLVIVLSMLWGWILVIRPVFEPRTSSPSPAVRHPAAPRPAPDTIPESVTPQSRDTSPMDLPDVVRRTLEEPSRLPRYSEVPPLSPVAEAFLVERYQLLTQLTNKMGLLMVLAYGGSGAVIPLLAHALTNEFTGQVLSEKEVNSFARLLHLMGYVAQRHRAAYEFLEAACEPGFWRQQFLPQSPDLARSGKKLEDMLLQYALIGLASTGRPEALAFLEGIRTRTAEEWKDSGYRSSVVDAVFWYRFFEKHGPKYSTGAFTGELLMQAFREWAETPEGSAWTAWAHPVAEQLPFQQRTFSRP